MSITIGDNKKKVTETTKLDQIVMVRKDIELSEVVDYHLLICRL